MSCGIRVMSMTGFLTSIRVSVKALIQVLCGLHVSLHEIMEVGTEVDGLVKLIIDEEGIELLTRGVVSRLDDVTHLT